MANVKISELTALTGDASSTDEVVINSSGTTYRGTLEQFTPGLLYASEAEARAGNETGVVMDPLQTANAIDELAGDVSGPASSTADSLARFDGTTGKLLKDGAIIGTDVQAYSGLLSDIAGLTVSPGDILYVNGTSDIVNLAKGTDGQVLSLSSGSPSWQDASGGGKLIQEVTFQDGEVATGTTITPYDDTIPQNTEGTEFMSLSITPTSATSKLIIEVVANYSSSAAAQMTMGLFQDTTSDAVAATQDIADGAGNAQQMQLTHTMTAGTTSATTFKVRIGANTSGTVTFNGRSSGRIFGGVMASTITIREVAA